MYLWNASDYLHCWLLLFCCFAPWPRFSTLRARRPDSQQSPEKWSLGTQQARPEGAAAGHELGGWVCDFSLSLIPTARGQEIWAQPLALIQTLFLKSLREMHLDDSMSGSICQRRGEPAARVRAKEPIHQAFLLLQNAKGNILKKVFIPFWILHSVLPIGR